MIRKAVTGDIDAVEKIYDAIHSGIEAGRIPQKWARNVYPTRQTADRALESGELFVEVEDGEVTAAAIINRKQGSKYENGNWRYQAQPQEVMVMHTLVVDPRFSGRGCGTRMMGFYEQYAKDRCCKCLRLNTQAQNTPVRRFYAKLGYEEAGITGCTFHGIPDVQLVFLEKKL